MTLGEAVSLHGAPSLAFNTEGESRELVEFADGTGGSGGPVSIETLVRAGLYENEVGGYNQTTAYRPEGKIGWLWISCFGEARYACDA